MMCDGNSCSTIVSRYSPTNVSGEMDIITFNNKLSSLDRHIPKHNVLIISNDMKAQTDKDEKKRILLTQLVKQKWRILTFHSRTGKHALILNYKKGRENCGLTLTQIILKHS